MTATDSRDWMIVAEQAVLIHEITSAGVKSARTPAHEAIYPLLDATFESVRTLLDLSQNPNKLRDSYVIARVIYETCLNSCFILAAGDEAAERAWRHAHQKSLRDLAREIRIGETQLTISHSAAEPTLRDPRNQRLLEEFTSKAGREIASWTPESVRGRLEKVYDRFGSDTAWGLVLGLLLYRHSSDIAHGSLFGALFGLGATQPGERPRSKEELRKFRKDQMGLVLGLVADTLGSFIRIVGQEFDRSDVLEKYTQVRAKFGPNGTGQD